MIDEFKKFILQGNLVEIAIGLILALKVKDVVDSLVADIITPIIAAIGGEPSFEELTFDIGDGVIRYGAFLNTVLSLIIVGFVLFLIVKAYNKAKSRRKATGDVEAVPDDVLLLTEIRDLLRQQRST